MLYKQFGHRVNIHLITNIILFVYNENENGLIKFTVYNFKVLRILVPAYTRVSRPQTMF